MRRCEPPRTSASSRPHHEHLTVSGCCCCSTFNCSIFEDDLTPASRATFACAYRRHLVNRIDTGELGTVGTMRSCGIKYTPDELATAIALTQNRVIRVTGI